MNATIERDMGILNPVRDTPLIRLFRLFPDQGHFIYGKLEYLNPGGSIKDRTSLSIIKNALDLGLINPDTTIIESTSGNMGIGLAQTCLFFGLKLILVVDPLINISTEKIIKTYGARVIKVKTKDNAQSYLGTRLKTVKELLERIPNSYWTNQYGNTSNPLAHRKTMSEILSQTGDDLDYVFVATSTCGTLMGCAEEIKYRGLSTRVIPVDAIGSVIFGSPPKKRLIPGFGASKKSDFLDTSIIADPIFVDDISSIIGCRQLLRREAIMAGGSTGAVVYAIRSVLPKIKPHAKIAFIINDRGERYLDTIYSDKWVLKNFGKKKWNPVLNDKSYCL